MADARLRTFLPAIAIGGVGVRIAYTLTIGQRLHFGSDSLWYQLTGSGIWGGYGYVDPSALIAHGQRVPTANFPPAYPTLIAMVHAVGFGSPTSLQILGALLGGVTVVLAGILACRVAGPGAALVVAGLVAIWPALIAADGSVMSESLATPLVLWSVLAVDSARRHERAWRWAIAGVPLGLAGLTRSELPLLAVVLVVMAALTGGPGSPSTLRRLASGLLTIGVAAAFLVPWSVSRVDALGSEAILPTNGTKALAGGNCPETYYGSDLGGWRFSCVQQAIGAITDEKGQTIAARHAGVSYGEDHLSRVSVVVIARELRTFGVWSPKVLDSDEVQESRDATWQRLGWWVTALTLPLAAAGCMLLWRRNALVLAPLFTIVVAAAVSIGNQRFRLPAEPILILAIVLALQAIGRRLTEGRRRKGRDSDESAGHRSGVGNGRGSGPQVCARYG